MTASPPRPDLWGRWFFRLVQIVGLALGVHEGLGHGRAVVLLFSGALTLGAVGLRMLLHGLAEISQAAEDEERR